MKITKRLKYATFDYDEDTKHFTIEAEEAGGQSTEKTFYQIRLNKVYAFAFMRFVVRMAQRNWLRQSKQEKKELDKADEFMLQLEAEEEKENPNQLKMFNNE